jgi:hypothetical protein
MSHNTVAKLAEIAAPSMVWIHSSTAHRVLGRAPA